MKTNVEPTSKTPGAKLDLRGMLERLRLPGIDTEKLLESGRKDIEALLETNEKVFVTAETLTHKQAEMLSEIMKEWQASLRESVSKASGTEKLTQASAHAQHAFATALTGMKEMAEITAKSNQAVLEILNKRYHEALQELKSSLRSPRNNPGSDHTT